MLDHLTPFALALQEGEALADTFRPDYLTPMDRARPWSDVRPDVLDRLETGAATLADVVAFMYADTGDAPCSRYGTRPDRFIPVALAVYLVQSHDDDGAGTPAGLDRILSDVVNDSAIPADRLVRGAHILEPYGITPADVLDPDVLSDATPTDLEA